MGCTICGHASTRQGWDGSSAAIRSLGRFQTRCRSLATVMLTTILRYEPTQVDFAEWTARLIRWAALPRTRVGLLGTRPSPLTKVSRVGSHLAGSGTRRYRRSAGRLYRDSLRPSIPRDVACCSTGSCGCSARGHAIPCRDARSERGPGRSVLVVTKSHCNTWLCNDLRPSSPARGCNDSVR